MQCNGVFYVNGSHLSDFLSIYKCCVCVCVCVQVLNQMTVSIHSFTTETGSPITKDAAVTSVFVECEFLDLDTAELETTSVLKPAEGQKAEFGFRKGLHSTWYCA